MLLWQVRLVGRLQESSCLRNVRHRAQLCRAVADRPTTARHGILYFSFLKQTLDLLSNRGKVSRVVGAQRLIVFRHRLRHGQRDLTLISPQSALN